MNWLEQLLARRRLFDDLSAEIRQHIEEKADELVAAGMPRKEAKLAARREFGNVRSIEERGREVWQWPRLEDFLLDVRYALRQLRRQPTFAIVAILILGLGIGANTAVYSLIDKLLLEPLPLRTPERLSWVLNSDVPWLSGRTSTVATYEALEHMQSFEETTAYEAFFARTTYKLTGDDQPDRVNGVIVAQNFFPFLGIEPFLGRGFTREEAQPGGPGAALLSHALWRRRYGADPDIVGRQIEINDRPMTIVGVMPPGFDFGTLFAPGVEIEIYVPLVRDVVRNWGNTLTILGRLAPGVTLEAAQAEASAVIERQKRDHPELGDGYGAILRPLHESLTGSARRPAVMLLTAVGLVLVIVCVNVSNLLLARSAARRKEIALRSALGAGRWRLVRQLMAESCVLSALGGGLGIMLAYLAIGLARHSGNLEVPLLKTVAIDGSALAAALLLVLATAFLSGLSPAIGLGRERPVDALKTGGRTAMEDHGMSRLRGYLLVSQLALACALLVGTGLLLQSYRHVLDLNLGFRAEDTQVLRVDAGDDIDTADKYFDYIRALVAAARAAPGVEAASVTDAVPFASNRSAMVRGEGRPADEYVAALVKVVGPGLFATMRTPLIAGRDFTDADDSDHPPVVIVNRTLAETLWPGKDPLGSNLETYRGMREVVGVVADVRQVALEAASGPEFYVPMLQMTSNSPSLVVRTDGLGFAGIAPALRAALNEAVPDLPTSSFMPLQSFVDRAASARRFFLSLLVAFAACALVLASIGIYGVVSYSIAQRTAEIGVRMALGASTGRVRAAVLGETLRLALTGAALGTLAAFALSSLLSSLLFEVSPHNPWAYVTSAVVLVGVAIAAGLIPAARAARIAPMKALRAE